MALKKKEYAVQPWINIKYDILEIENVISVNLGIPDLLMMSIAWNTQRKNTRKHCNKPSVRHEKQIASSDDKRLFKQYIKSNRTYNEDEKLAKANILD